MFEEFVIQLGRSYIVVVIIVVPITQSHTFINNMLRSSIRTHVIPSKSVTTVRNFRKATIASFIT